MTIQYRDFSLRRRPPRSGRALPSELPDATSSLLEFAEGSIGQEFKGITVEGTVVPDLFGIGNVDISNDRIRDAADAFLGALTSHQRDAAVFPVDSDAWRRWSNIHPFIMRHGALLDDMSAAQRDLSLALLKESLSAGGVRTARDVMRLNESIREITGSDEEYGEWLYWLSVFGTPSPEDPWGWQIDGHHLIINCLVLGSQLVATPMFMGSEPVAVDVGKYAGTRVFEAEERAGVTLARSLTQEQLSRALISDDLPGDVFTTAFRDNFELRYEGVRYDDLASGQQALLLGLIGTYLSRMRPADAEAKMGEVKKHLRRTYLAWMGGIDEDSVFYYRIHSPVILIEFDHQRGIAMDNDEPSRNHVHTVVRTPNGNDYGKDLLRQHREALSHVHS